MSGANYKINCPECGKPNELRGKAMTIAMTCQSCQVYFNTGSWSRETVKFQYSEHQAISLGTKGRIDGFVYEVMGFVVKQETVYHYRWREYLVFNPYRGYAFLTEYDGHWNFVWPIENDPRPNAAESDFQYNNSQFKLYQKYSAEVVYARGEFFFDVFDVTLSTTNSDYIAPPYLLSLEQSSDSILWFEGMYLSIKDISDAFSISKDKLPSVSGIGTTQPVGYRFSDQSLITLTTVFFLAIFLIQIVISNSSQENEVFNATFYKSQLKDQKMLATEPFMLDGGTKSLVFYIWAPLSNDWFFSEFSLINDDTGEEYNFTKEVEYYSGYDDGGSWSEGSQIGEAFLSQIPSGKYRLNIYPEFSFSNSFSVTLKRDVPTWGNFYITCIGILLFPLFYFLRKRWYEKERWSDSEYSPYEIYE